MTKQLTPEEFAANIYEYLGKGEIEHLEVVKDNVTTTVTFMPGKIVDRVQVFQDIVGPIDLPANFDAEKFIQEERWRDYENLN
ncbi:MAG: hypothetical protein FWB98_00675 [Defluviitaleaceae bacterium]|nr:hypothetical protein [Defluviitaleaceae bacterium]